MSFVCPRISPEGSTFVLSTRALPLDRVFIEQKCGPYTEQKRAVVAP